MSSRSGADRPARPHNAARRGSHRTTHPSPEADRDHHPARPNCTLVRPTSQHADTSAGWSRSAQEATSWCSRTEHPLPAHAVTAWWQDPDVTPWLLLDPTGTPTAYGEIWDDQAEDESELARLIVDPTRRRTGRGRQPVQRLVAAAQDQGRSACYIRVTPGNHGALPLYRSTGFRDVDDATAAAWNQGQPAAYHWLEHPAFLAAR